MGNIIDGKLVSKSIKQSIASDVNWLNERGISVNLAVIMVGDNAASQVYVRNKQKACEELGIVSRQFMLPEDYGQDKLIQLIENLNMTPAINGILCQLPLPAGYDEKTVLSTISPTKDVDAFHPCNVGRVVSGDYGFLPCTPAGIIELLDYYNVDITGKNCVVIGRSNIVGKPVGMLLLNKNGTVTITHSKTVNLASITSTADILIAAVGKANFVTADMVKDGAVVIDVGINRIEGKLCGDVDFQEVSKKAALITPVPGGVGPMTIAMLMKNTVYATKLQNGLI